MSNRWIRFLLAVIAIAAAAGAAYRVVQHEQHLAADLNATRAAQFAGEAALATVEELKAALHAYVAPGQGADFWTARAGLLLDKLRSTLLELDAAATASGGSLAESLDTSDRLAEAEKRAREHVRNGQALLAGDVIFTEARDLVDGLRIQIARARDQIAAASARRTNDIRQEQTWLLAGAAGILALVILLLVTPGRATQPEPIASAAPDGLLHLNTTPAHLGTAPAHLGTAPAHLGTAPAHLGTAPAHLGTAPAHLGTAPAHLNAPAHRTEPVAPVAPVAPAHPSSDLASLCFDIAAVTDSRDIEQLLGRAATLLDARGVIIWMSSPDRFELSPVAAWGYDERVLARLGSIQAGSDNLTAAAFRDNAHRAASPAGTAAAAVAVPLPSPDGPAGVFAAELTPGIHVDEGRLTVARVIAAQLGALLGSIPSGHHQDAPHVQQRH